MVDYRMTYDASTGGYRIESPSIISGSVPVNIPEHEPRKRQFISLYLIKADIEEAIGFVQCMSMDKHIAVNRALFAAALINFMKCFQSREAIKNLKEDDFLNKYPELREDFGKFKSWRNKHFVHDENSMRRATAFLIVAPESFEGVMGGAPSVIWNTAPIDFSQERRKLETILLCMHAYVLEKFDKMGESILKDYMKKTREELLEYGIACINTATTEQSDITRNDSTQIYNKE